MGLSPDLFKRLSRLNREWLRTRMTTADRVEASAPPAAGAPPLSPAEVTLERFVAGEARESPDGRFYLVRRRAEECWPSAPADDGSGTPALAQPCGTPALGRESAQPGAAVPQDADPGVLAEYRRVFHGAGRAAAPGEFHEDLRPLIDTDPAAVTYLDIETCGLAGGEPLFLVGLMRWAGGTLRVEQYLARDYAEERGVLAATWAALADSACLVTFNGRTFDLPIVEARSLAVGLFGRRLAGPHVDLLAESRRRWRGVLPNCRLQTIEQEVCGRYRAGDIPGSEIPAAYHEFVRAVRGDDVASRVRSLRKMQAILHHNALDLVTMAELAARLLATRP